jgi:hypothetical protein
MNVFLPRPEHSARPSEIHAIGRVVRSEREGSPRQGNGFATMNHTTLLRETRGKGEQGESAVNELGQGRTGDEGQNGPVK